VCGRTDDSGRGDTVVCYLSTTRTFIVKIKCIKVRKLFAENKVRLARAYNYGLPDSYRGHARANLHCSYELSGPTTQYL